MMTSPTAPDQAPAPIKANFSVLLSVTDDPPFMLLSSGVMSPQNVTNVVWYILVQLSFSQAIGRWRLATGGWSLAACLWVGQQQEASSQ
jgi:hypothetical protein